MHIYYHFKYGLSGLCVAGSAEHQLLLLEFISMDPNVLSMMSTLVLQLKALFPISRSMKRTIVSTEISGTLEE
jgi:hypothetical protein